MVGAWQGGAAPDSPVLSSSLEGLCGRQTYHSMINTAIVYTAILNYTPKCQAILH